MSTTPFFQQFSKDCLGEEFSLRLVPLNPKTGDFEGNLNSILKEIKDAHKKGISLLIFPELALSGYNMGDLFLHSSYLEKSEEALKKLCEATPSPMTVIIGVVKASPRKDGKPLVNTACVIQKKQVVFVQEKTFLANDDVFYEPRYFEPSEQNLIFPYKGYRLGLLICEDLWNPLGRDITPVETLCLQGADLLISLNASPFHEQKNDIRLALGQSIVQKYKVPLAYVNLLGGNDDLLFDGHTFFISGEMNVEEAPLFSKNPLDIFFEKEALSPIQLMTPPKPSRWEVLHKAVVLGLGDYVRKSGFSRVHLGLSGGIDSALVAKLAVDALGPENVVGFLLPSAYSSESSLKDARELAERLKIQTHTLSIKEILKTLQMEIDPVFESQGLVEENLQSRIRGILLMAYGNAEPSMLLTTGNKSEIAVGYCTIYGDMNGAFNPIGDIYKTDIFALCAYLNKETSCFPENILTKAPSAELRPEQKDEDSLPPYPILDSILKELVEKRTPWQELAKLTGQKEEFILKLAQLVKGAEFKRFQASPILKLSPLAFGSGRIMPLARANFELQ